MNQIGMNPMYMNNNGMNQMPINNIIKINNNQQNIILWFFIIDRWKFNKNKKYNSTIWNKN